VDLDEPGAVDVDERSAARRICMMTPMAAASAAASSPSPRWLPRAAGDTPGAPGAGVPESLVAQTQLDANSPL
jgi:hypothetical protein